MTKRISRETAIEMFRVVHGNRYDYSNVDYINTCTNISITCKEHGSFQQRPTVHLRGNGCQVCSGKKKHTTKEIIDTFKEIYGDEYDYSCTEYKGALKKFKVLCRHHGEFETIYNNMLRGWACPQCTIYRKNIRQDFLKKAKEVHGDKYDYSKVDYKNCLTNIEIICMVHGSFFQQPRIHINGNGCQKCNRFNTSKIARNWLKSLNIPHLRTFDDPRGEYKIPETRWKVDGYDEDTNTIYEFHGDYWHAHPSVSRYKEDEKHPRKKSTWGEVYKKTLEREQKIRDLGYNLVVIWEHEFLASLNSYQDRISLYTT